MHCPFCSHSETKVNDSRLVAEGHQVRRRRECLACGERFTSFESAELIMPRVIKRDGVREPFNEENSFGTHAGAGKKAGQRGKVGKRDGSY